MVPDHMQPLEQATANLLSFRVQLNCLLFLAAFPEVPSPLEWTPLSFGLTAGGDVLLSTHASLSPSTPAHNLIDGRDHVVFTLICPAHSVTHSGCKENNRWVDCAKEGI